MTTENSSHIPTHVGFIMDGNGRWAKLHGKPRSFGHKKGAEAIESVVSACFESGVQVVSLYAFSTENWQRPENEVQAIMKILDEWLSRFEKSSADKRIKLVVSGDLSVISSELNARIKNATKSTEANSPFTLNICFNYGSRHEICAAVNAIIDSGADFCDEKLLSAHLYTASLPDVDLIVRTGGEQRLSNFLLWQSAYAEIYFTDVLWPEFDKKQTLAALQWFAGRSRRFGKI